MREIVPFLDRRDADDRPRAAHATELEQGSDRIRDVMDDADAEHDVERSQLAREAGSHQVPLDELDLVRDRRVAGRELGRRVVDVEADDPRGAVRGRVDRVASVHLPHAADVDERLPAHRPGDQRAIAVFQVEALPSPPFAQELG
jgi:hypothetical protein